MWRPVGGCPLARRRLGDVLAVGPALHQTGREEGLGAHRRAVPLDPQVVVEGGRLGEPARGCAPRVEQVGRGRWQVERQAVILPEARSSWIDSGERVGSLMAVAAPS